MSGLNAVKGNTRPIYRGEDFTGRTIGDWTVLGPMTCERVGKTNTYKTKWLCQCKCSSEPKWVIKENLTRGISKGCYGCYGTRNSGANNGNWKGHGKISGEVFNRVRNGAAFRDIPLELTHSDLNELWLKQNGTCALTGIPLTLLDTASLDRIDSDQAYVVNNVQWVHKTVNKMKNDLPQQDFIQMCQAIAEHASSSRR